MAEDAEKAKGEDSEIGHAYDANGNTLSDAQGRSFTWDFENRLTQVVVPGTNGGTTTFKYDPFGRRIQKSGPLGTTNYLYDGANILAEVDKSGNVLARYAHSRRIDQPLAEVRSSTTSYYESDALGSVTSMSSSGGTLATTYTYDSYGNIIGATGALVNPFQYTGRELDPETGTYYYRARYYNQSDGRFLSEDPIGFVGTDDLYAYVGNRPTLAVDPSGMVTVIPLPDPNIHRLPDIDPNCGITSGGCERVGFTPDWVCEKGCDNRWRPRVTITLYGDIYVATGPFPYRGRPPGDRSIRNTNTALAHEMGHVSDKLNAILPIYQRFEGGNFGSKEECDQAGTAATAQALPAWTAAGLESQRHRH